MKHKVLPILTLLFALAPALAKADGPVSNLSLQLQNDRANTSWYNNFEGSYYDGSQHTSSLYEYRGEKAAASIYAQTALARNTIPTSQRVLPNYDSELFMQAIQADYFREDMYAGLRLQNTGNTARPWRNSKASLDLGFLPFGSGSMVESWVFLMADFTTSADGKDTKIKFHPALRLISDEDKTTVDLTFNGGVMLTYTHKF
jgi:hypothetical protein